MAHSWMLKPKFLVFIPLVLVLLIAIACGADATPRPAATAPPAATPTPAPTATPQPVLAAQEIQSLVTEAVKAAVPPPAEVISASEIQRLVETAVAAAAPKGATSAEVRQLVEAGVAAVKADAASKEEVASLVSKAVADATATLPEPVSAAEIEKIVKAAIPATPTPAPTATPPPAVDPRALVVAARYGGVVPTYARGGIRVWDPHQANSAQDLVADGNIYNQLLEYNPINPSEIIGDVAESWDVSTDALTFTFNLRDDIKWTDGQTLDADDVVFSLKRMIDTTQGPRGRTGKFRPYLSDDPVEKVDQTTVRMKLAFPSGAFIRMVPVDFNKILPQHVLEAGIDINVFDADAVGSGPWKRVAWDEGITIEWERNPDYFKTGLPYFDGLLGFFLADKGIEIAAYKTERILMGMSVQTRLGVEDLVKLESDEAFMRTHDIYWMPSGGGHNIWMNMAKPPYDDPNVRKALFLAIDRDQLTDTFGLGHYQVGGPMGPLNPLALPIEELRTWPGYRLLDGKKHPDDITEAKRLMAEAGHADGFKTTMLIGKAAFWPDAVQLIKQQLKDALNIDMDIVIQDIPSAIARHGKGEHDLTMWAQTGMIADPDDRFRQVYLAGGSFNWSGTGKGTGYEVPGVRELFEKQQREPDPDTRKELNYEMQRLILAGTSPTIEFTHRAWGAVVSKRIRTVKGPFVQAETQFAVLKHDHEWLEAE